MFEKLDEGARQAVVLAQEQAIKHGGIEIAPVHLLVGVALSRYVNKPGRPYTAGAKVLRKMGLKGRTVLTIVREARFARKPVNIPPQPGDDEVPAQMTLTTDTKRSLELAFREGLSLGHNKVRAEHILLGLLRLGDPTVLGAFTDLPRHNVFSELMGKSY